MKKEKIQSTVWLFHSANSSEYRDWVPKYVKYVYTWKLDLKTFSFKVSTEESTNTPHNYISTRERKNALQFELLQYRAVKPKLLTYPYWSKLDRVDYIINIIL
jgi:hypothetical protein